MHKVKSAPVYLFKSLVSEGPGVFEAVVSVFGNVDLAGDRVLPGAFAGSLDRWKSSGDPIPIVWSHQWDDLDAHVGEVLEAKELLPGAPELVGTPIADNGGLWIKGRLDVDDPEEAAARRLWKRMEKRRIREFSFAYDVLDERRSTDGANDLVELDVIEVGPTLKGMNPATVLLTAKSLAARVAAAKSDDPAELERILAAAIEEGTKATPTHAFIPGDEDADRCSVCGSTRGTLAHLHTLSGEPDAAKAFVTLAGSVEERLDRIHAAGMETIDLDAADGGFYDLALEGTFDDRVVFRLEGWNDPFGGGSFYECSIVSEDGDEVELGEPVEVVIEGATRAKSARVKRDAERAGALKGLIVGQLGEPGSPVAEDPATGVTEKGLSPESTKSILDALEVELA